MGISASVFCLLGSEVFLMVEIMQQFEENNGQTRPNNVGVLTARLMPSPAYGHGIETAHTLTRGRQSKRLGTTKLFG